MTFTPKKYYCTVCNKGFRRQKQHYNHVTNAHRKGTTKNKVIVVVQHMDQELTQMTQNKYFGGEYDPRYPTLTGNRHTRTAMSTGVRFNPGMRTAI